MSVMDPPIADGLIYYPDSLPGIRRVRRGRGFSFVAPDGTAIDCQRERTRLKSLAVPPAYEDVWMCPKPNGHIQATGHDVRARKQYIYHPDWTAFRARLKFDRLAEFGHALPRIRRRLSRDLKAEAGELTFALASIVTLIDRLGLRIGNHDYTRRNGSYGATTLRNRHVKLKGDRVEFRFRAKGGQRVQKTLRDRRLLRILQDVDDLPGRELFTYLDGEGRPAALRSDQVNAYLHEASGDETFSAKTFRTWIGTITAFEVARKASERLTIRMMAEACAERLNNTPTIARSSYIHPDVIALAELPADERKERLAASKGVKRSGLRAAESALLGFLEG